MTILRRYSQGPDVSLLQLGLTRSGYRPGSLDGIFGPMTENAVKGFQVRNGLAPDGIVGPQTWRALLPYLKGYTVYSVRQGDTPVSYTHLDVYKRQNKAYLFLIHH